MPFKKKQEEASTPADDGRQLLHEEAVRLVKSQHGKFAHKLDNYNELLADTKNQISQAQDANKTF